MSEPTTYLIYCFIENGVDVQSSSPLCQLSITHHPLSEIHYKDIAVIAERVSAKEAEELNSNEELLKDWLALYQQTNTQIFRHYMMLPLRFGVMVPHKEDIEGFLADSYIYVKDAMDRLRGKAEFSVNISWDINEVLKKISQDQRWLDEASESVDRSDRIEVGRLLFQRADMKKKEIVGFVHDKLSQISLDSSKGISSDESIIMKRSYLIEKSAEESFDTTMLEIAEELEDYLNIKYMGPMPPYSFTYLEFKKGNFELIDEVRRRLMLPESASREQIKSSYRKLSLKYHPDKNSGDPQSSEYFKKIDEAYKIIQAYCNSHEKSDTEYSFKREEVEGVFMVERAITHAEKR